MDGHQHQSFSAACPTAGQSMMVRCAASVAAQSDEVWELLAVVSSPCQKLPRYSH